jgi:hypothetical protein
MLKNKKIKFIIIMIITIIVVGIFIWYRYGNSRGKSNNPTGESSNSSDKIMGSIKSSDILTGVNIHSLEMKDDEIKKISGAGLKIVRIDLFWSSVENKKGVYDFSKYDRFVKNMERNNVKILFVLDYGNKLYDNGLSPHTDEGRKAFVNFAKAAVERYKGKQIMWEIWNEPNASFWHPKPNWEDYFKLAMETIKEIKAVDKDAFIAAPAASEVHFDFLNYLGKAGLFKYIDAVSVHPYRGSNPETVIYDYKDLKTLIGNYSHKNNIQIFSSEWGYTVSSKGMDDMKQAQYCIRQYLLNTMSGVKLSIWYDWKNDGNDKNNGEHNYGTMYSNLTPKPTYYAIKTMNKTLKGYDYIKRVDTPSKDDYVLMFKKDNKIIYAAWTSTKDHDINLNIKNDAAEVTDLTGKTYEHKAYSGKYKLHLDESVKYILN